MAVESGPSSWVDAETTALHAPVYKSCILRVDRELVLKCQEAGMGTLRGKALGTLSPLWPVSSLKDDLVTQAKEFQRHMTLRGFEPTQSEWQLELWGPYREKVDMSRGTELVNIEEGNPFFPDGRWVSAARAAAPAQRGPIELDRELLDHRDFKKGVHFIVRGLYLRDFGKQDDVTGKLIV